MKKLVYICVFLLSIYMASALDATVNDYDPRPAEAGKAVNVWFKVENKNIDAEDDVFIEILPKDGLKLTSGEKAKQNIGILPARTSQIVQYRLIVEDNAFKGSHEIEVKLGKGTTEISKTDLSIEITDKDFKDVDLSIGDIESDPTRIKPDDDDVKLEVTIQNLGDGKAQGVKAELVELPEGITLSESYSGTSLLGNIEADSTNKAIFYIDVDENVKAQEYTAQIRTTYKYKEDVEEDEYTFEQRNIPLKIAVKPVPLYEITDVKVVPEVLTAGDRDVLITFTIENVGEEEGESVRIKAYGKTEQPIVFEKSSDFIAPSLKPGETGQATLEIRIEDDASLQKYYLDLEIKNIVNEDVITYNKKVPIVVTNPKPDNPWKFVGIGIVIIFIVGGYILFKRHKKGRQKAKAQKIDSSYGKSYLDKMKK